MQHKQFLRNNEGSLLGFIVPITSMFFVVLVFHLLFKIGIDVPPILLEPVFDLWIVFVGILISVCIFMRQFFMLFLTVIISFVATVLIYIMYALE